jgi:hypothetical protein
MVESLALFFPLTSNVLMSQTIPTPSLPGIFDKLLQPLHQLGFLLIISLWLVS